jgi:DHA2 family multidrug resistance protein
MVQVARPAPPYTIVQVDMQAPYYKWLVAGIVLLAGGTQTFAGNSVNLAIPRLMAAFGTDLAAAQWVTTSFLISRTLIIPVLGWLGSVMGNRNLFVAIMVGFVVSSIGCGLATSLPMLVFFRLIQGFMLGPMEGLTAVIMVQIFPAHQRGLALGLRTIGWSIGQIISFTIGGYFMEQVSWRLLFFLGVPTGILSAILGLLVLPQQREYRGEPVDYPGLLSLGGFLVPLLLLISLGRKSETAQSTLLLLGLMAGLGGVLFVLRELLAAFPAVNLRLFRLPGFRLICATAFFNSLGLFGAQFMVPIFLQQVMGLTPLHAGLVIVPALIVSGFSGVITGRITDLVSPSLVAISGLITLVTVFYFFSTVTALTTVGVLVTYIVLYRVCMFSISTPLTTLNVQVLGTRQLRMGQGLLGVVRNIGASLGVTVTSVFFEQRRLHHQLLAYDTYDDTTVDHYAMFAELKQTLQQNNTLAGVSTDQAAFRAIRQQLDVEAIAAGFRDSFLFICGCFVLAMIPVMCLALRRPESPDAETAA